MVYNELLMFNLHQEHLKVKQSSLNLKRNRDEGKRMQKIRVEENMLRNEYFVS